MKQFIITSYYTLDTPYQKVSHDYLLNSLRKLNLKSDIRGVNNLGNWQKNTLYKATFIKQMLEKHIDRNVVFLDADAEILKYPALFDEIPEEYNFAAHFLDRDKWYNQQFDEPRELLSGTLFLRNSQESKRIVEIWEHACASYKMIWEQRLLQTVIEQEKIKVFELPIEYAWIKSMPNGDTPFVKPKGDIIIQHNQVSRQLKNKV